MRAWSRRPRAELCRTERSICYGIVQPGQPVASGVPIVRVNNFRGHGLDLSDVLRVDPEIEAKFVRSRPQPGDLLISHNIHAQRDSWSGGAYLSGCSACRIRCFSESITAIDPCNKSKPNCGVQVFSIRRRSACLVGQCWRCRSSSNRAPHNQLEGNSDHCSKR